LTGAPDTRVITAVSYRRWGRRCATADRPRHGSEAGHGRD
jgi:hypothetical protein